MVFGLGFLGAVVCLYCHVMSNKGHVFVANTMLTNQKDRLNLFNFSYITVLHVVTGIVLAIAAFDVIARLHIFGLMSLISTVYLLFFVWRIYIGFVNGQEYKNLELFEIVGFLIVGVSALGGLYFK